MSDEAFDLLVERNLELSTIGTPGDTTLPVRMWSLKKYYDDDPTLFVRRVKTPKLDGVALQLVYNTGVLSHVLTRGDGVLGRDVTLNAYDILGVPEQLPSFSSERVVICGELAATGIDNARNVVAGLLNLKDRAEVNKKVKGLNLRFFAYDAFIPSLELDTYTQVLETVQLLGFYSVAHESTADYPQDGYVVRTDSLRDYENLGFTAKHPRGAYAVKARSDGLITTLKEVVWQTGRTGVITPVGLVEPVKTHNGATISRVSLNNPTFIQDKGLRIGSIVRIERAGDIIPRVIEAINSGVDNLSSDEYNNNSEIEIPKNCPKCGESAGLVNNVLYCLSEGCSAKLNKRIENHAKVLKIKGLGPKTIGNLALTSISELYLLSKDELAKRLGSVAIAEKLHSQLEQITANKIRPETYLQSLGIPRLGKVAAEKLAPFMRDGRLQKDALTQAGLGERTSEALADSLSSWADFPPIPIKENVSLPISSESSYTICISGRSSAFVNRAAAEEFFKDKGVRCVGSVSPKVDYVICDQPDSNSSKVKKAKSLNIPVIETASFLKLANIGVET